MAVCLHYGDEFVEDENFKNMKYLKGILRKYDYVPLENDMNQLEAFADLCNLSGVKRFYVYKVGFNELTQDMDVLSHANEHLGLRECTFFY